MRVYLDNNATTPLAPEVREELIRVLDVFGNPSSAHEFGREARHIVEEARQDLARLLDVEADELVFTSGGSESNNLVIKSILCRTGRCVFSSCQGTPHVITTAIEHPCVIESCRCLEHEGVEVTRLPVDADGRIAPDDLKKAIRPTTRLVSIMMANNETGVIQPIQELAQIARDRGVLFHTDAVQAIAKIPVYPRELGVDFLTVSGHKFNGPKGVGALWFRSQIDVCPLIIGGHQEGGRRAGTENTLGIVGMGAAARLALGDGADPYGSVARLRDYMESSILEKIPYVRINSPAAYRLPNTLNASFSYVEGESIQYLLDFEGVAVSTGSACSTGSLEPSHVLLAMGLDHGAAHGSIRFSLGRYTTEEDVDYAVQKLVRVIDKLRDMSPLYRKPAH